MRNYIFTTALLCILVKNFTHYGEKLCHNHHFLLSLSSHHNRCCFIHTRRNYIINTYYHFFLYILVRYPIMTAVLYIVVKNFTITICYYHIFIIHTDETPHNRCCFIHNGEKLHHNHLLISCFNIHADETPHNGCCLIHNDEKLHHIIDLLYILMRHPIMAAVLYIAVRNYTITTCYYHGFIIHTIMTAVLCRVVINYIVALLYILM